MLGTSVVLPFTSCTVCFKNKCALVAGLLYVLELFFEDMHVPEVFPGFIDRGGTTYTHAKFLSMPTIMLKGLVPFCEVGLKFCRYIQSNLVGNSYLPCQE